MRMGNMQTRKRDTNMAGIFPKANALALLLAVLSLSGCRNPFELQNTAGNEPAEPGILSLTIGRQGLGRTIMPESWLDKSYIVRFDFHFVTADPYGNEYRIVILEKDPYGTWVDADGEVWLDGLGTARIELGEGTWNLTVTAFRYRGGGETHAMARGNLNGILVLSGETVVGDVALFPNANAGGQGTFCWEITFSTDVAMVSMEIMRFDVDIDGNITTIPYQGPLPLVLDGDRTATDSLYLDVGRYLVVFTLYSDPDPAQGQSVEVSAILHIYWNMVSRFTGGEVFPGFVFPRSLLCFILDAWDDDNEEWDFVGHEITAGHFGLLGIEGINAVNFGDIVGRFDYLSCNNNLPGDLEELKALVDAALIGINMDIIVGIITGGVYTGQAAKEAAIRGLQWFARNTLYYDDVEFDWDSDTVTITVLDIFAVEIDFADPDDITWTPIARGTPTDEIDFVFSSPVSGLNVANFVITGGPSAVGLSGGGTLWTLSISGVTGSGYIDVTINKDGIAPGPYPVTVTGSVPTIAWTANAVGTPVTTAIIFSFSAPVEGLTLNEGMGGNVTVDDESGSVTLGTLTMGGNGMSWSLAVAEVVTPGIVSVSVSGSGIVSGTLALGVIRYDPPITWYVSNIYNDPITSTTTAIYFNFNAAVGNLTADQVELQPGTGRATVDNTEPPEEVLDSNGRRWRVAITTERAGTVAVNIDRSEVESRLRLIEVSKPDIGWVIDAVGGAQTSAIDLYFDALVAGLRPHHIVITPEGNTSVTWGSLEPGAGNAWSIGVGTVTTAGDVSIRIDKDGIDPVARTVTVSSGLNFISTPPTLSAGRSHTVAIGTGGSIYVWGHRHSTTSSYGLVPTRRGMSSVPQIYGWVSVAAGESHTMAIREDRSLWGWGGNSSGQLGNGGNANVPSAVSVTGGHSWRFVTAGGNHTVAIREDGTLWTWGDNTYGQLGRAVTSETPANAPGQVQPGTRWVLASANRNHTLAIGEDGSLWGWGQNWGNRIGLGTGNPQADTPIRIMSGTYDWRYVSAGYRHSFAIRADGSLWGWGVNSYGQIGLGDHLSVHTHESPQRIITSGAASWKHVSAGDDYTIAIGADGSMWVWGLNSSGQLGNEGTATVFTPTQIAAGTNWRFVSTSMSAGPYGDPRYSHTVAICDENYVWTWGNNAHGQLGRGTPPAASTPGQVVFP